VTCGQLARWDTVDLDASTCAAVNTALTSTTVARDRGLSPRNVVPVVT